MSQKVLILGASGTGKSHSIQYLDPKSTFIFCPDKKELPFRGSTSMYRTMFRENGEISYGKSNFVMTNSMKTIRAKITEIAEKRPDITDIIIDTVTYAMIESVMREINTKGYDKFSLFAEELYLLIDDLAKLRDNLTVWVMAHTETEMTDGVRSTSFKVPAGKLTKEKIVPEGLFTIVLYTECVQKDGVPTYCFVTQNDGSNTGKSPAGMFPALRIENNLQYVKDCIFAYYNNQDPPQPKIVAAESDSKSF